MQLADDSLMLARDSLALTKSSVELAQRDFDLTAKAYAITEDQARKADAERLRFRYYGLALATVTACMKFKIDRTPTNSTLRIR